MEDVEQYISIRKGDDIFWLEASTKGRIWVSKKDGEGAEFSEEALFEVIKKFYEDNF